MSGEAVEFDQSLVHGDVAFINPSTLMVGASGTYLVSFAVLVEEGTDRVVTLERNGSGVNGGIIALTSGVLVSRMFIVDLAAGDDLQLVNTGVDPLGLNAASAGSTVASMTVIFLHD